MKDVLYRVLDAQFVSSAPGMRAMPKEELPEAAFVGRSNVGKSTLLNAVCGRKALARTSRTPGRTQLLNFFRVRVGRSDQEETREEAYFVDLPGYGYAKVAKSKRRQWPKVIEEYLLTRRSLAVVVLLVDCRRDAEEEEKWFANLGKEGNLLVALTKTDKLSKTDLKKRADNVRKCLHLAPDQIIFTSVSSGKKQGIDVLTEGICARLFE
jgi:GTP-binding protein